MPQAIIEIKHDMNKMSGSKGIGSESSGWQKAYRTNASVNTFNSSAISEVITKVFLAEI